MDNRIKVTAILMVLVGLFAAAAFSGCANNEKEQPKENVVPVKTVPVTRKAIAIPVNTSGRLYPKAMVKLSFKTGGLISKLSADEGDSVKKGQLLATLDLLEIKARHNQAQKAFEKATRDLERAKNLYKDRAATLEQKQNAGTAFDVAQSNLDVAAFNLQYSRIKAPANGKILKRLAETGEMVGTGTPVFLFGSTENQWVVKAGVSARDMVKIKLKDPAKITFDAYPGRWFTAAVSEISTAIDPASGTYEIELALETSQLENITMAAGFVGKTAIEPAATETLYVIPVDAVVEGEGNDGVVFSVRDKKAVRLNIEVAHIFPERVAVRTGLENIERVVTSGAAYLTEGTTVTEATAR